MVKKALKIMLVFTLALTVFTANTGIACAASKPVLSKTSISIEKGKTTTLTLRNAKGKKNFSSTNSRIASVSKKGKITAKKPGKCVVKVKYKKRTYKCKVTVKEPKSQIANKPTIENTMPPKPAIGSYSFTQVNSPYAWEHVGVTWKWNELYQCWDMVVASGQACRYAFDLAYEKAIPGYKGYDGETVTRHIWIFHCE